MSNALGNGDVFEVEITIKDHKFNPDIIEVPEGKKIRLTVHNDDNTIEEFESIDLKRERLVPANSYIHINIAPLKPGKYNFFGEFYQETAKGCIIVK
jgi:plastocyanin domain-containing protein